MEALRKRSTFKFSEDNDDNNRVLDEQEQDDVITELRLQYEKTRKLHLAAVDLLIFLSAVMQTTHLWSEANPLLMMFPPVTNSSATEIPFPAGFTVLSLTVYLNFVILLHPDPIRTYLQLSRNLKPLSYNILYLLSALAPAISLLLHLPWQTIAWWSLTPVIVFVVQSAIDAAESSSRGISELESKRYVARGA